MKNISTLESVGTIAGLSYHNGKVRESYQLDDKRRAIVVTDRISAFDVVFGTIPCKGQVLNQVAGWWFEQVGDLVPHHFIEMPHPNISLVKNAQPLPIEIIVRGYLTGSTNTSSWYHYQNKNRVICGIEMPEGMQKNQAFEHPIITPTTKPEVGHDESIRREDIISQGLVDEETYVKAEAYALKLFAFGQKKAREKGLILVDTKYEMGLDVDGNLMFIDEIHTPDSSRYWMADTYEDRFKNGEEPDMLDKEFFRGMMIDQGFDPGVADPENVDPTPYMGEEVRLSAGNKYKQLYTQITGEVFEENESGNLQRDVREVVKKISNQK